MSKSKPSKCGAKLTLACSFAAVMFASLGKLSNSAELKTVPNVDGAALHQNAKDVASAVQQGSNALGTALHARLHAAAAEQTPPSGKTVQHQLDPYCLLEIGINPESRVKVSAGPAAKSLKTEEWCYFLVKVVNEAGVTAPIRFDSAQLIPEGKKATDGAWLEMERYPGGVLKDQLSGSRVEYRVIRLRAARPGKRAAVIAADVGQGTADIGFRNDVLLTFDCIRGAGLDNARTPTSEEDLRYWLQNMVQYHGYSAEEIRQATGMSLSEIAVALDRMQIGPESKPEPRRDALTVMPFPGGVHPRIGFKDHAIRPQRETKASVFTPWDNRSYVVLDVPEAIWSNLGLLYLAHEDVPTVWSQQSVDLQQLEWTRGPGGALTCERALPNGVVFGVELIPTDRAVRMEMWLTNGTTEPLTDLRVQNCVLLKFARGFQQQTNDNKVFWGPYAACRDASGERWIISAWDPIHRSWANQQCPCLHSDPQFPDCPPGETKRLRGWLSFYEGRNIHRELLRVEREGWRLSNSVDPSAARVSAVVVDAETGMPIPARVYVTSESGEQLFVESEGGTAVPYSRVQPGSLQSSEVHTTVSAAPFSINLPAGEYEIHVERGKEFLPSTQKIAVGNEPMHLELPLQRWVDMADRGWYSGDTHVHRSIAELPNVMLAEDLNVAFPMSYWVTDSGEAPVYANGSADKVQSGLLRVDGTHVIYPVNTEYEIDSIKQRRHTLGAILALNHRQPFDQTVPPVSQFGAAAREQGALLDLEKHSWPWSLMLVPVLDVDLFELSNNHLWRTDFALRDWTLDKLPPFLDLETDELGFTESGWTDFGIQTYYMLLNCGFRMRVSAGTASGVHPVPLGYSRVYAHVDGPFTYDKWVKALDRGNSFVSNGPMLVVTFNGKMPGHTFSAGESNPTSVVIEGTAESPRPLARIEIVMNGRVCRTITPANNKQPSGAFKCVVEEEVPIDGSSWLAVRCFEEHPEGRVRFAHTNPVFIDVEGRPLRPRRVEVQYFVNRMHEELASNHEVLSSEALQEYRRALAIYEKIAETAR